MFEVLFGFDQETKLLIRLAHGRLELVETGYLGLIVQTMLKLARPQDFRLGLLCEWWGGEGSPFGSHRRGVGERAVNN